VVDSARGLSAWYRSPLGHHQQGRGAVRDMDGGSGGHQAKSGSSGVGRDKEAAVSQRGCDGPTGQVQACPPRTSLSGPRYCPGDRISKVPITVEGECVRVHIAVRSARRRDGGDGARWLRRANCLNCPEGGHPIGGRSSPGPPELGEKGGSRKRHRPSRAATIRTGERIGEAVLLSRRSSKPRSGSS